MKRIWLAAVLAAGVAGCALIIDLGDKPTLADLTDGGPGTTDTGASGGPIDSAPTNDGPLTPVDSGNDSGPVYKCGLPPSTNADCDKCITERCCDVGKACQADPRCVAGLECVKDCLVQSNCVLQCFQDFPEVKEEATCSAFQCAGCTPGPKCSQLGKCVFDLPKENILRQVEKGRILNLDEKVCDDARKEVASDGTSDAGACFEP